LRLQLIDFFRARWHRGGGNERGAEQQARGESRESLTAANGSAIVDDSRIRDREN